MEKTFRCCDVCGEPEINGVPRIEKLTYYLADDKAFVNDICQVCAKKIVKYLRLVCSARKIDGYWKDVYY